MNLAGCSDPQTRELTEPFNTGSLADGHYTVLDRPEISLEVRPYRFTCQNDATSFRGVVREEPYPQNGLGGNMFAPVQVTWSYNDKSGKSAPGTTAAGEFDLDWTKKVTYETCTNGEVNLISLITGPSDP